MIRDHLGNNRVFFSDTNGGGFVSMSEVSQAVTLVEVPTEASGRHTITYRFQRHRLFGMAMQGSWLSTSLPENKYRHNGIEQTANLGLDVYNAFYRTLDPSLGRWSGLA
ncbi:hypothetical protein [Phaeodactylibacter xiamenensis]|uniref:hypothetical protein n=1 Tax=Phaeodactylibacter xiamenensis TaxID=1524460 RepID=UPI0024A86035|nr:hypothetical protein [Phaeodactylibacter xiamenensis]